MGLAGIHGNEWLRPVPGAPVSTGNRETDYWASGSGQYAIRTDVVANAHTTYTSAHGRQDAGGCLESLGLAMDCYRLALVEELDHHPAGAVNSLKGTVMTLQGRTVVLGGTERNARKCTYQEFMKCKPTVFKGTEGVVEVEEPNDFTKQWWNSPCNDCYFMMFIHDDLGEPEEEDGLIRTLQKGMSKAENNKGNHGNQALLKKAKAFYSYPKPEVKPPSEMTRLPAKRCTVSLRSRESTSTGLHGGFPAKIESIKIGHLLSQPTEIRQFLRFFAGYYRRLNEGFSKSAKPMTKLTQQKVKFEWCDKQEATFQLFEAKVVIAPILCN
ncbi:hypothetical protein Tco_0020183 [Tanacetum coccineum]